MMRALVIVLAVLAGLKVWTTVQFYREGTEDALVLAYRDRAIAACQSQEPASAARSYAPLWTRPASVAVAIGRRSADVDIWDYDHPLWEARFKHPQVVLTPETPGRVCEYDILEGRAYLTQGR